MSCLLKPSTGNEDFLVAPGQTVTIKLTGQSGAKILHIRYGNEEIDATKPFQFKSRRGANILTVLAEAPRPGVLLHLREVCPNGDTQALKSFYYDPMSPARGFIIRGKRDA